MKIERNNYEMFFLDYFENTLAAEKVAELFLFLENNPDLKKEFDNYASTEIPSLSKTVFSDKDSLKKPIVDDTNAEEFMLRSIDNDLNENEQHSLDIFLNNNPLAKQEYDLLCKTKLKSNTVFYADKLKLRKKGVDLNNYQTYLIAELEGDLTEEQQAELDQFLILHPELIIDKTLLAQTILSKDPIEFPEKNSLKKAVPLYAFNYQYLSIAVAACIVLLLGIWFYNPEDISSPDIAEQVQSERIEQNSAESNEALLSAKETDPIIDNSTNKEVITLEDQGEASSEQANMLTASSKRSTIINSQNLLACGEILIELPAINKLEEGTTALGNIIYSKPDKEMLALINEFYDIPQGSSVEDGSTQLASLAKNNLSRMADDSYVASTVLDDNKKGGRKLFELVATGVSKITNDKMRLNGRFNDQDELVAYRLQSNKVNLKNKY